MSTIYDVAKLYESKEMIKLYEFIEPYGYEISKRIQTLIDNVSISPEVIFAYLTHEFKSVLAGRVNQYAKDVLKDKYTLDTRTQINMWFKKNISPISIQFSKDRMPSFKIFFVDIFQVKDLHELVELVYNTIIRELHIF